LYLRFRLSNSLDDVVYLVNFLCVKGREYFTDLKDFACVGWGFRDLAYDLSFFGATLFVSFKGFLFWKYFDIMFTSLAVLARRRGGGRTLSIETGVSLGIFLFNF